MDDPELIIPGVDIPLKTWWTLRGDLVLREGSADGVRGESSLHKRKTKTRRWLNQRLSNQPHEANTDMYHTLLMKTIKSTTFKIW